jgi:prepilin-type N-terminal cleavage/methylation domain-containing protein
MKTKLRNSKGFTIIEVLIVLAIAGLIMLIVFLAVPALQRNGRNTSVRNDAAGVLGGVNEFVSNNNGQLPTGIATAADGTITFTGGAGTQPNTTKIRPNVTVARVAAGTWPANPNAVNIAVGFKCTNNTTVAASTRSFAALFRVESGSGVNPQQCVDS